MPSPKYRSRKPRSRPSVNVEANMNTDALPALQYVISGGTPDEGGLGKVLVLFAKPLQAYPDDTAFVLRTMNGLTVPVDSWGMLGNPFGDDTVPTAGIEITYVSNGSDVNAFEYQPAGKVKGDTDPTGIPVRVPMFVNSKASTLNP